MPTLLTPFLRRWLPDWAAIATALVVLVGSLVPANQLPAHLLVLGDKALHGLAYFALAFCATYRRHGLWDQLVTFAAVVSLGGIIELLQTRVSRSGDWYDFAADVAGAGLGWLALRLWRWLRPLDATESAPPG